MAFPAVPPASYRTPLFPSLNVQTIYDTSSDRKYTLYYIDDVWRFTVIWTLIFYALFHLAAVIIALFAHGWRISSWKYLWGVPVVYLVIAAIEAVLAGSIVGVMCAYSTCSPREPRWRSLLTADQAGCRVPCGIL
jgi:hypothetical protein